MPLTLDTYRLLGRSGLRVSPLALGAATFGTEWGWGAGKEEARALFDHYVERGGNFVDTANTYTDGSSERLLGEFAHGRRESLVLATKYTTLRRPGDPNSGGGHRKSLFASVEASLRRLRTDYLDLLHLHVWDPATPVEEILRGLDDLVRQGKILYAGISNSPAWQVSRLQAIADLRGWTPLVALQIEYNLIERTGERDLIPMAREMGLGVLPYSPLAGGLLTGKYSRADLAGAPAGRPAGDAAGAGRSAADGGGADGAGAGGGAATTEPAPGDGTRRNFNLALGTLTERNLSVADAVREVAAELGRTPAQVGLAWTLRNPAVTAPVVGARTPAQLADNLGALDVDFHPSQLARLDAASAFDLGYPHAMLASEHIRKVTAGDLKTEARR